MPRVHPDRTSLDRLMAGHLDEHESRQLGRHLLGCPSCRRRASARDGGQQVLMRLLAATDSERPREEGEYDEAISRAYDVLLSRENALARERDGAPRLYRELMRHPPARRRVLIDNTRRFHNWGLVEHLLERAAGAWFAAPGEAEELATTALAVASRIDPAAYSPALISDLKSRCWTYIANSRRVASDLRGAEEAFAEAERCLAAGTRDPVETAQLLHAKSSLRRDQRRFDDAESLLRLSGRTYRRIGDRHQAGKVLLSLSTLLATRGESERAIEVLRRAVELIDAEREPRLSLMAHHNLIDDLADCGRFMEAQALLARSRDLYREHADPSAHCRWLWVRAKVAAGLGQKRRAEEAYREAREAYLAQGLSYDAAQVSLELALLYAGLGRHSQARRVARETLEVFRALDIRREAIAARLLVEEATAAERLSVALVEQALERLREAAKGRPGT